MYAIVSDFLGVCTELNRFVRYNKGLDILVHDYTVSYVIVRDCVRLYKIERYRTRLYVIVRDFT